MKIIRTGMSLALILVLVLSPLLWAQDFADQHTHPSCQYCGMDRVKFGHSRMLVAYKDGGEVGTCSLHCMSLEYANSINRVPVKLLVSDYNSGELIDAHTAFWVLGGDRRGVMTARAKWAFNARSSADAFISQYGGSMIDFDQAMKASYEDMYADVQRIRKMRAMKRQKTKGQ